MVFYLAVDIKEQTGGYMYRYRAFLTADLRKLHFIESVDIPCVADAIDGFWINNDNEFTRAPDCTFWIPPAQILYVKKIVEEGDE